MKLKLIVLLGMVYFFSACSTKPNKNSGSETSSENDGIEIVYRPYKNTTDLIEYEIPVVKGTSIKHGIQKRYNRNGSLYSTIPYLRGMREDTAYTYYMAAEGVEPKVWKEQVYENDELNGICRRFHENGVLQAEYEYKKGLPAIGLKEYSTSGKELEQPTLIVTTNKVHSGFYVSAKLSKSMSNVDFYLGDLVEGKYLPEGLKGLQIKNGLGEVIVENGTTKVTISAIYSTRYRNRGILTKTIHLE
ncbi:hypothetical protein [uncultured Draconibacterium sp.]|uniref:toxin-antitoxin system YwqK family antitoxin n=1 Tax=uncultured Draconibacterium sp. TaxID=1573823 RepID=UPI0032173EC7